MFNKLSRSFFVIFASWTPESANFDRKFEIYAKNHPQNRILRSGIENPGPILFSKFLGLLFLNIFCLWTLELAIFDLKI